MVVTSEVSVAFWTGTVLYIMLVADRCRVAWCSSKAADKRYRLASRPSVRVPHYWSAQGSKHSASVTLALPLEERMLEYLITHHRWVFCILLLMPLSVLFGECRRKPIS